MENDVIKYYVRCERMPDSNGKTLMAAVFLKILHVGKRPEDKYKLNMDEHFDVPYPSDWANEEQDECYLCKEVLLSHGNRLFSYRYPDKNAFFYPESHLLFDDIDSIPKESAAILAEVFHVNKLPIPHGWEALLAEELLVGEVDG